MSLKTSLWVTVAFCVVWVGLAIYAVSALILGWESTRAAVIWLVVAACGLASAILSHRARVRQSREVDG